MKRGTLVGPFLVGAVLLVNGCSAGGKAPVNSSDDADSEQTAGVAKNDEKEGWSEVEQKDVPSEQKGARKDEPEEGPKSNSVKDNPTPEFKAGGTVDEAINAVPQGLPRENLDTEDLNKPLMDPAIYEPCKPAPSARFEIRFAVWDGQCVGVDIKTTPKNPKLESCLREVVGKTQWRAKTKSLNIGTVSF